MKREFLSTLSEYGVKFIRVIYCDNANIIRGKAIHLGALERYFEHGIGLSHAQQSVPVVFDGVSPGSGLGPVGEVRLVPDWDSFIPIPYSPGHSRVIGNMILEGKPWPYCTRFFLKRMIEEALKLGIEFRAAYENEFYLLCSDYDVIKPVDNTPFASTLAMDINYAVIGEITDTLIKQGIMVEQYYPESGPGQQEISIGHTSPLKAADNQIAFRETVKAVAGRQGLKASFLPKIFSEKAGSGCHIHMSIWENGRNIDPDFNSKYGLSSNTSHFIAGVLKHLNALMAITVPTTNSYRRIKPHNWCGAYRCWGIDNREAAIRVVTDPADNKPSQFEFKVSDATSNPYLALGALIASGLDGIRNNFVLPDPVEVDPGNLSPNERQAKGIDALPSNLAVAIENLKDDEIILDALGKELSQAYLAVKNTEYEAMKGLGFNDEVMMLLDKY